MKTASGDDREDSKVEAPDTYGLPDFFVTNMYMEAIGSNVRYILGVRRGSSIQWLCSVIVPADLAIVMSRQSSDFAEEIQTLSQMAGMLAH